MSETPQKDRKFLFILCPPYSGSTLLWQVVGSSPNVSMLPEEGQHLEETSVEMRGGHWEVDRKMDWEKIRGAWEDYWDLSKPILLEKSPPNLLRAPRIEKKFPPAYFIGSIRNPYAFAEGVERRNYFGGGYRGAAEVWVKCAKAQRRNLEQLERITFCKYEDFTESPERALEQFREFLPQLDRFDVEDVETHSIVGTMREIENLNSVKIDRLDKSAVGVINGVLQEHRELLDYFEYELMTADRARNALASRAVRVGSFVVRQLRMRGPYVLPAFVRESLESLVLSAIGKENK